MTASTIVEKNVRRLCHLLAKEKTLFEYAAGKTTDHTLRGSILSVAQQNNQYAVELSAHIFTATEPGTATGKPIKKSKRGAGEPAFDDDNKLLLFCSSNETKIVSAYRYILRNASLYEGLEKMMRYQLKGIHHAAGQLKLLSKLKTI
jgi:hypothetical protein